MQTYAPQTHLALIKVDKQPCECLIPQGIGTSYLLLKGAVCKIDNALATNRLDVIHRRRINLYEAIKAYKYERTQQAVRTKYEKKIIFLGDELLVIACNLLQISSLNLLASLEPQ